MHDVPARRIRSLLLASLFLTAAALNVHCGTAEARPNTLISAAAPVPSTETAAPSLTATHTASSTPSPAPTDTLTPTSTVTALPSNTPRPAATRTAAPAAPAGSVTTARTARVPILMFHHVGVLPPGADAIRTDLTVSPDVFDAEMKYLVDQGYHSIRLADLVTSLQTGAALPPRPIVLTFDDGYDDNYQNAFPTLKDHGLTGTFFIITARADAGSYGYMNWAQIEEMAANGMEIGSHSVDHLYDLARLTKLRQWNEIKPADEALAAHFPDAARIFSYPSGSFNATTESILAELGYIAAVTTRQGVVQSSGAPFELKRIRIKGAWSPGTFAFWLDYWTKGG
ncbi:MAG: polysaccharide deacetylase family protein [Rudaea sp.]